MGHFYGIILTEVKMIERPDFTNMNGLVAGKIPKGVICPFRNDCTFFTNAKNMGSWRCKRHDTEAMKNNFSCATARLFSIIKVNEEKNV